MRAVGSLGVGAAWLPGARPPGCASGHLPPSWGCRLPQLWLLHEPMGSCLWLNPQEAGPF